MRRSYSSSISPTTSSTTSSTVTIPVTPPNSSTTAAKEVRPSRNTRSSSSSGISSGTKRSLRNSGVTGASGTIPETSSTWRYPTRWSIRSRYTGYREYPLRSDSSAASRQVASSGSATTCARGRYTSVTLFSPKWNARRTITRSWGSTSDPPPRLACSSSVSSSRVTSARIGGVPPNGAGSGRATQETAATSGYREISPIRTIRPAAETSRSARGRAKLFGTTSPRTMTSGVTNPTATSAAVSPNRGRSREVTTTEERTTKTFVAVSVVARARSGFDRRSSASAAPRSPPRARSVSLCRSAETSTISDAVKSASIRRQKTTRRTTSTLALLLRQRGAHADLDDPQPFHPLHGEGDPLPRGLFPGSRHPPELVEEETGDRVEIQVGDPGPERLVEMADRRLSEDEGGTVGAQHDLPLFPVPLFPDLPEQLLENVLHRHDPGRLPVLVHDDRDVHLPPLELAQERREFLNLGDDVGGPDELLPHRRLPPLGHRAEQLLEMEDADDVVPLALVYRNPGPAVAAVPGDQLLVRQVLRDHEDVGQGGHDLPGAPIGHLEDVVDELLLLRVEGARLLSGVDQRAELRLGDHLAGLRPPPLPHQEEDPPGDLLQPEPHGGHQAREGVQRRGGQQRETAGPRPDEALRRHVPDQQDPQRPHEKGEALAGPGGKMRQEQGGDDRGDRHVDDLVSEEDRRDQPVRPG